MHRGNLLNIRKYTANNIGVNTTIPVFHLQKHKNKKGVIFMGQLLIEERKKGQEVKMRKDTTSVDSMTKTFQSC